MNGKQGLLLVASVVVAAWFLKKQKDQDDGESSIIDSIGEQMDLTIGAIRGPGPVASMSASPQLRAMLKNREKLRLERYNLGDGGWTIGYGHFEKDINDIPARITPEQAERMFDDDLYERAEKWVKLYVTVDLTQEQYDALVHIAFNMSPKSFKKFAEAVNRGEGIDGIAAESIAWVSPDLRNGIRNRRNEEITLFNYGLYA